MLILLFGLNLGPARDSSLLGLLLGLNLQSGAIVEPEPEPVPVPARGGRRRPAVLALQSSRHREDEEILLLISTALQWMQSQ